MQENEKKYKEYKKLMLSEVVTAIVVGALIYEIMDINGSYTDLNLIIPGVLLVFILLQGAGFQYYRMLTCGNKRFDEEQAVHAFDLLDKIDPWLFAVYPVYLIAALIMSPATVEQPTIIYGVLTVVIAALEYCNYYKQSLSYRNWSEKEPSDICKMLREYREKRNGNTD
ncbi:MAG: hypothetical protein ACOYB8_01095 [Eubacteriaceae bacterium]|jgi:mannose/fructose/N-acetylgalactosamine-specific phosphotransferase system component IID